MGALIANIVGYGFRPFDFWKLPCTCVAEGVQRCCRALTNDTGAGPSNGTQLICEIVQLT